MTALVRQVRNFFVSLKLTVVLLALSIILIFAATLAQVNLGIWAVQQEFFHSFIAIWHLDPLYIPMPGGYLIGGLLLINLVAAHVYRFKLTWKKSGIFLTHIGLIMLLVGELLSGLWQEDFQMRLEEGTPKNFSESYRFNELAITDATDPQFDDVVAIPEELIARGDAIQHPKLPFRVVVKQYFPNSAVQPRNGMPGSPPPPPSLATTGPLAERYTIGARPITYAPNDRNLPAGVVELIGPEGAIGSWLVTPEVPVLQRFPDGSSQLVMRIPMPQRFTYGGRTWEIELRPQRAYKPFTLTLLKFSHDIYAGTDIPKNFSSRIRLSTPSGTDDREVLIYMNNPLRYAGLTFYQASFEKDNPKISILQVVRNPSWQLPYISCLVLTLGLVVQFGIHLVGFIRQRSAPPPLPA
jgi:hypothetical protein